MFWVVHPTLVNAISQECLEGIFFKFGRNVHLHSRMNLLKFGGQRSEVKVTINSKIFFFAINQEFIC